MTNAKAYDSTTSAAATPTVSGLMGADNVTGKSELYADAETLVLERVLSVSAYTINDGNSGNNYAVTTLTNTTGVINKAPLTITAATNTKTYDSTTVAAATPGVSGLKGSDTLTGRVEVYSDKNAGSSKTLSVKPPTRLTMETAETTIP